MSKRRKALRRKWHFTEDQTWKRNHPEFYRKSSVPDYGKSRERTMWCSNEYFNALATWQYRGGIWSCVQADTVIQWMKKMSPSEAKMELLRRGCVYGWK